MRDITDGMLFAPTGDNTGPFEARQKNPQDLAYVGDAVHSLYVRTRLAGCESPGGHPHARSVPHLSAPGQARALEVLLPDLNEEERAVVQRGRNARPANLPRHASAADYHSATAFEALLGYLYLGGCRDRLAEILDRTYTLIDEQRRNGHAGG